MDDKILFIDTETGGLNPSEHSLLSIALVVWQDLKIIDSIELYINDGVLNVTKQAIEINKIDIEKHKKNSITPIQAIKKIKDFLNKHFIDLVDSKITLAGHNVNFDVNFLRFFLDKNNESFSAYFSHRFVDTSSILYYLFLSGKLKYKALSSNEAFQLFKIKIEHRHTALGDAVATAELFTRLILLTRKKLKHLNLDLDTQLKLFD
jgi:DNA polymerase III subunit epsilon